MGKNLSKKHDQKLFDSAKISTADATKIASKRAIQKTAEATVDLFGNKTADKITSVSKTKELQNNETEVDLERATPKKTHISPEEKQEIIDEFIRLI